MRDVKVYTDDGGEFSNDIPEGMHEHERHVWIWKPEMVAWFDELDGYHLHAEEFGIQVLECDGCEDGEPTCGNCDDVLPSEHVSIFDYSGGIGVATCGKTECNTEIAKGLVD